jgi:hypothetical protein
LELGLRLSDQFRRAHDLDCWVLADIAAEERRADDDTPRTGLSAYTLACLESELGIM